ncbi:MAG: dipeptide/oligopeptide/nickel ABC transporter permease/ATP-binding protein [Beijerinckiaceae bacterium]
MRQRFPWFAFALVMLLILVAAAAPWLPLENPVRMRMPMRLAPPSADAWLGRDEFGRDVLSRIVWGARASLTVAFLSAALAAVIGTALGIAGGFMRGLPEWLTMRSMDVLLSFPPLLLALLAVALLGPGVATLIPVLAFIFIPGFTRVAYAGVLTVRSQDYVEAVRALGAPPARIMRKTVLPNILGPVLVQLSLAVSTAIVLESGLSFLGLGVVPPTASWGLMIGAARATMNQQPLLLLWPCLALTLTILIMNSFCDGLRDMFDPNPPVTQAHIAPDHVAPAAAPVATDTLLAVRGLSLQLGDGSGAVQPVRGVDLDVRQGETLAIVGESGSGKSLTGLAVMGLLPPAITLRTGTIWLAGRDVTRLGAEDKRALRGKTAAMIFQDPMSSLNPVMRVGEQIAEAMIVHGSTSAEAARTRAVELLESVGIPDAAARAQSYPHELSGGMRQRVMIAMAIANDPVLLIADEPTTALDVTIQAQVLDLLATLKSTRNLAMIFISHSLPVVADIADRVAVMYAGEVVEEGPARDLFTHPLHPYTAALIACSPSESEGMPRPIDGVVPSPADLPPGCVFAARCAHRVTACVGERPALRPVAPARASRCIRWSEL